MIELNMIMQTLSVELLSFSKFPLFACLESFSDLSSLKNYIIEKVEKC